MRPLARTALALALLAASPAAAQGYRSDRAPAAPDPAAAARAEATLRPALPFDLTEPDAAVVHVAYGDNHVRWCLRNHPGYSPRSDSFPARGGARHACVSPFD